MQPFERLRAIARHGGDDRLLVSEAADCLGEFDDDPAALVVTCRRLLHHHPERAPLWWLCARVLAAPDPSEAAWDAEALMRDDRTPDRLAALLPFPADHPVAVLGWPELIGAACAIRPDLETLVVRGRGGDDRWHARLARSDASARPVDLIEAAVLEPSHLLVEVAGAGLEQVLVADGTADALSTLARPGLLVWLVAGVGTRAAGPAVRGDAAQPGRPPAITVSSCSTCRSPTGSPARPGSCAPSSCSGGSTARWRRNCSASARA